MVSTVQADLESKGDALAFERGIEQLGRMLGATTHRWTQPGAPDGLWMFGDWHTFVFECKTDERPGAVSLNAVRQAATHEERARADKLLPQYVPCSTMIVSNHTAVDPLAAPHVKGICHVTQSQITDLFHRAAAALEEVRTLAQALSEETLQSEAERIYRSHRVFMPDVEQLFHATPLARGIGQAP